MLEFNPKFWEWPLIDSIIFVVLSVFWLCALIWETCNWVAVLLKDSSEAAEPILPSSSSPKRTVNKDYTTFTTQVFSGSADPRQTVEENEVTTDTTFINQINGKMQKMRGTEDILLQEDAILDNIRRLNALRVKYSRLALQHHQRTTVVAEKKGSNQTTSVITTQHDEAIAVSTPMNYMLGTEEQEKGKGPLRKVPHFEDTARAANSAYLCLWFKLWEAKVRRWKHASKVLEETQHLYENSAALARRKWAYRAFFFVIIAGIAAVFYFVFIPNKVFDIESGNLLILFVFLWPSLEYVLYAVAIVTSHWPQRGALFRQKLGAKDGVAFLVASWNSPEDELRNTLTAAKEVFNPTVIYVCENENPSRRPKRMLHGKPIFSSEASKTLCDELGVNFVYIPEGNKSHSFEWVARHYLPEELDNDVEVPHTIDIPINGWLSDPKVAGIAYTIRAAPDLGNDRSWIVAFQDLEYKLAGLVKVCQSNFGAVLAPHGAISIWKTSVLRQILWQHNTVFHGEDLQMGMLLSKHPEWGILKTMATECVPTTPPSTWIFNRTELGLKSLATQRIKSWDVTAHRYFFKFIAFTIGSCIWPKEQIILQLFVLTTIWTLIQDWTRVGFIVYFAVLAPWQLLVASLRMLGLTYCFLLAFNYFTLNNRSDLRTPLRVILFYPFYQVFTLCLRMCALVYNLMVYTAEKPDLTPIKEREDRHNLPPFQEGLEQFKHYFLQIWDPDQLDGLRAILEKSFNPPQLAAMKDQLHKA